MAPAVRPPAAVCTAGTADQEKFARFTFEGNFINECTGEEALITVSVQHSVEGEIGAIPFYRLHGTGVGLTSGARYRLNEVILERVASRASAGRDRAASTGAPSFRFAFGGPASVGEATGRSTVPPVPTSPRSRA